MTPDESDCAMLLEALLLECRLRSVRGIEILWEGLDGTACYQSAGSLARSTDERRAALAQFASAPCAGGVQ